MRFALLALLAIASLAACSPKQTAGADDAPAADLAQARAALDRLRTSGAQVMGLAPPTNLPAYAVLPPDGFVTAAGEGEAGPTSGWLVFSTALSPGAASAFYEEALSAAGLKTTARSEDGRTLTAAGPGGQVKLSFRGLDGVGSEVRLSYS